MDFNTRLKCSLRGQICAVSGFLPIGTPDFVTFTKGKGMQRQDRMETERVVRKTSLCSLRSLRE